MTQPDRATFRRLAEHATLVPMCRRIMSDQLTPVLAYRRLVSPDERTAPSFLFESVEGGDRVGRYSLLGAQPAMEIIARGHEVIIADHRTGTRETLHHENPLRVPHALSQRWATSPREQWGAMKLPPFTGGWVGYAAYDTVRYLEPEKLPFEHAPRDDRGLPDLHFGLYRQVAVFDHVAKVLYAIVHVLLDEHASVDAAFDAGAAELDTFVQRLEEPSVRLAPGSLDEGEAVHGEREHPGTPQGNFTQCDFERAVERCKEYISAGDAFQIVLSQRFERQTSADPFDLYRALRIVNPSPYMIYLQVSGCLLIASSPEILCRCRGRTVTNRPLAGTRKRGMDADADALLEKELLANEKERAEHVMLVDLGRNDLGRICALGSIRIERVMDVERYSHVMHLSSTVTGTLRDEFSAWDALRETLPAGTVSGAPKIRAMQIIDELEPTRRGPYAGGIGYVSFEGDMDIALALRTMVVPVPEAGRTAANGEWTVHLQAGAGIVADSQPTAEYEETVNKAAALNRAIDFAEGAFADGPWAVSHTP